MPAPSKQTKIQRLWRTPLSLIVTVLLTLPLLPGSTLELGAICGECKMGSNWYLSGRPNLLEVSWNAPIHPNLSYGEEMQPLPGPEGKNETAVSIELSATSVPSDFSDFLDIRIDGLLPGQSVNFEKFKVTTAESIIDSDAILQRHYVIQDGYSPGVAGVPNLNIPNDFGDTLGEITFQLDFWEPDLANVCGHYIYRVSSPHKSFEPTTIQFTVIESPTSSEFRGVVTAQGEPVPYALVGLLNPIGGYSDFVAGTTADEAGRYRLFAPYSDEFDLVAVHPGYVGPLGHGVSHFVEDDETLNVDLELRRGTVSVSGRVSDYSDPTLALGGVEVLLLSMDANGQIDEQAFSIVWTDAEGRFTTSLSPGKWGLLPRINSIYDRGYVNAADRPVKIVDIKHSALTNLDFSITRGTSLISGFLTSETELDENGEALPLCGIEVIALNEDRTIAAWGITDGGGYYQLAVLPGRWIVGPFTYSLWEAYYGGTQEIPVLIPSPNVAFQQDLTARPSEGDAFGFLTDEQDQPIGKLRLLGINRDPDRPEKEIQMTYNFDGLFCFGFPAGEWIVFPDPREAAKRRLLLRDLPKIHLEALNDDDEYPEFEFPVKSVAPQSWIDVSLLDPDGNPVAGVGVHAALHRDGHQYDSFGFSDSKGIAKLPALPGDWELHASSNNLLGAGFVALDPFSVEVERDQVNVTKNLKRFTGAEAKLLFQRGADDEALSFQGQGEPGMRYLIEASSDLSNWTELGHVTALDGAFTVTQNTSKRSISPILSSPPRADRSTANPSSCKEA